MRSGPLDDHDDGSAPTQRTRPTDPRQAVRLRLRRRDLWSVERFQPTIERDTAKRPQPDDLIDVRILLYPDIGPRLTRIMFFTSPEQP